MVLDPLRFSLVAVAVSEMNDPDHTDSSDIGSPDDVSQVSPGAIGSINSGDIVSTLLVIVYVICVVSGSGRSMSTAKRI